MLIKKQKIRFDFKYTYKKMCVVLGMFQFFSKLCVCVNLKKLNHKLFIICYQTDETLKYLKRLNKAECLKLLKFIYFFWNVFIFKTFKSLTLVVLSK